MNGNEINYITRPGLVADALYAKPVPECLGRALTVLLYYEEM